MGHSRIISLVNPCDAHIPLRMSILERLDLEGSDLGCKKRNRATEKWEVFISNSDEEEEKRKEAVERGE